MKRLFIILYGIILINVNATYAQDPMFSQFYANPLYLAPSFAGASKSGSRIALNYRDQWSSVPNSYRTYTSSFDHYFNKIRSGIGAIIMRDIAGSAKLGTTYLAFMYSFDFQINEEIHLRPGLSMSYLRTGIDYTKLVPYEMIENPTEGQSITLTPLETNSDIDMNISTIAYTELFWAGINVTHLLKPDIYLYGNNYANSIPYMYGLKMSAFGGYRLRLRGNLLKFYKESLTLAFLFEKQQSYRQLNMGAYYHINPLVFGVWYRGIPVIKGNPGHDAMVFLLGYQISDFINIGYSYDFTLSGLSPSTGGSHEISFVYNFKIRDRQKKPHALPCPDI